MTTRHLRVLSLMIVVVLSAAGCAPRGETGPTAPPVATDFPTPTEQPTSPPAVRTPSATRSAPVYDYRAASVRTLDDLQTYRVETTMVTQVGDAEPDTWTVLVEYRSQPPARRMLSTTARDGDDEWTYETIQIGETTYIRTGDTWVAMSGEPAPDEDIPDVWVLMPGDLAGEGCQAQDLETVNGYEARHYGCDIRALTGESMDLAGLGGTVVDGEAHVWLSTEHQVPVRSLAHYTVQGVEGTVTTFRIESNVTDINRPLDIVAPEAVEPAGLPDDVPMIEGAQNVASALGITTFRVQRGAAVVAQWYLQAMADEGWELDREASTDEMLAFTKDDRTAMIVISAEDSDSTSVTVLVDGAGV